MNTARDSAGKDTASCTRETCPWPHCSCNQPSYPHAERCVTAAPKGEVIPTQPGAFRCRPAREQGFALEGWMVGAVVGVVAIIGLMVAGQVYVASVEQKGYDRGVAETKLAAEEERKARDAAVAGALDVLAKKVGAAEAEAERYRANWTEARNGARGKQLGSCKGPGSNPRPSAPASRMAGEPAAQDPGAAGVAGGDRGGVRLLWRFVGLYDGAHVGNDGKPVFGATAEYAGAPERADAASPYGLDEVIDTHGANAQKWADCRRDLNAAIDAVEAAEAAYERGKR